MVFVINGYLGAGKDTFVELVKTVMDKLQTEEKKEVINISTIDYLKDIFIKEFGWDGKKTKPVRAALSLVHNGLLVWDDIPFKKTCEKVEQHLKDIVFIHCREPKNIKKYVEKFNALTIFVENLEAKKAVLYNKNGYSTSDLEVEDYNYDIIINNNGSFEDLEHEAEMFVIEQVFGF